MPATFFNLSKDDVFKSGGGGAQHLVKIPMVDDIVSNEGLAIYNSVSLMLNETIQYFLTFDDVIKFIHFGKGVGTVNVEGTMYCTCEGALPGLSKFSIAVSKLRGKQQSIAVGSTIVSAILTQANVTVVNEPDTMANFAFAFSIVNHNL